VSRRRNVGRALPLHERDRFGVLLDAPFSLRGGLPDETFPTFAEAVAWSPETLVMDAAEAKVVRVRYAKGRQYTPIAGTLLLTLTCTDALARWAKVNP